MTTTLNQPVAKAIASDIVTNLTKLGELLDRLELDKSVQGNLDKHLNPIGDVYQHILARAEQLEGEIGIIHL